MKCFYHNDLDGKCSGYLVKLKYPACEFRSINYNQDFPFDDIKENEEIFIVDYSLEPDEMEKLYNITENISWIDHHISTLRKYEDFPYEIAGIREVGKAGCHLTFEYLFDPWENQQLKMIVNLIEDWDIWEFRYGKYTTYFHLAMLSYDNEPNDEIWDESFKNINRLFKEGKTIKRYRKKDNLRYIRKHAFEINFKGYKCIVCNKKDSSDMFENLKDYYDIMIPYVYNGEEFIVSLYTVKEDIDLSKIAEEYGGGGHKQAAGFHCNELPF